MLQHRAIEVDVGARGRLDAHAMAEIAVDRMVEREERFAEYWRGLAPSPTATRSIWRSCAARSMFEGSFPPLRELRRELAPATEMSVVGGAARWRARRLRQARPGAGRARPLGADARHPDLAIDLKTGSAYPAYAEDNRLYALVLALRFGVPPYRVASLFLESGKWQAEDVGEELHHAADRVIDAARSAAALRNGREPALTPGV